MQHTSSITTTSIKRARRRLLARLLTIAFSVTLAAGLVFVWIRVIQTLREPSSTNQPRLIGQPGALVWDNRVFTSPTQLKAYLGPKAYAVWAKRHPTAFGAPAPPVVRHPTTTSRPASKPKAKTATATPKPKPKPKPVTPPVAAPQISATKSRSIASTALTVLLLLAGLALAASAITPPRLAPVAVRRFYTSPDRRMAAIAAALAILMGFAVSFYL